MFQDLAGQLKEYQAEEQSIMWLVVAYNERHKCNWTEDQQMKIYTMILYKIRMELFDNLPKTKI